MRSAFGMVLRVVLLLVAAMLSLASAGSSRSRPQDPPPPPAPGAQGAMGAAFWCHTVQGDTQRTSLCRPTFDACERERQAAQGEGLKTSGCAQVSPVSCFQLWGDGRPSHQWCSASAEDCETWRRIDREKNAQASVGGPPSSACTWMH